MKNSKKTIICLNCKSEYIPTKKNPAFCKPCASKLSIPITKEKKVYCSECEYCMEEPNISRNLWYCQHPNNNFKTYEHDDYYEHHGCSYYKKWISILNEDNNCKWFEEKK